jgi:MarR family transcriptional regulator, transcriptional regulator for hemolysin
MVDPLRNFGFLLKDVARLSIKNFERLADEVGLGLSLDECKALIYVHRTQGINQVDLAGCTGCTPMTLMRILDRMEQDGWVERRPDPEDRRVRRLYLTRAAMTMVTRIWAIADRARAESLAGLDAADRERLIGLLERIRGNLLALVEGTREPERAIAVAKAARKPARASMPGRHKHAAIRARGRARTVSL